MFDATETKTQSVFNGGLLMFRIGVLSSAVAMVLIAVVLLYVGCAESPAPPTHSEISKAMAQLSIDKGTRERIIAGGENLIPTVLGEMRRHPTDTIVLYNGWSLVRDMAVAGKADPSAPFIRRVATDERWPLTVRSSAVLMLYWFWDSPVVHKAIALQCTSQRPREPDRELMWETFWRVAHAARMSRKGSVEPGLVEQLLSTSSANETLPLDVIGETSIPVILDEFDAHRGSWDVSLMLIVERMLALNTADPTGPALRAALENTEYRPETRHAAAYTLIHFPYSDRIRDALIRCIDSDHSENVKIVCLEALGHMASLDGKHTHWDTNKPIVNAFSRAVQNPNKTVRLQARRTLEDIKEQARAEDGVRLDWADALLGLRLK